MPDESQNSGSQYGSLVTESLRRLAGQADGQESRIQELEKRVVELVTKTKLMGLAVVVGVPIVVGMIQLVLWVAKSVVISGSTPP